jgi:hypothetical protein
MSAIEPLCNLVGVSPSKLTKEEYLIIEVELFVHVYEELKEHFKEKFKEYFRSIKYREETENAMIEANFVRCVINDILLTGEYTLEGIAYYTQTPGDVLYELAMGSNTSPSAVLLRKLVELHKSVRRELYDLIMKKISAKIMRVQ